MKKQFLGLGKKKNNGNRVLINPVQNFVGDCVYIA